MDARWEHFEHGADIGVRGIGPTREAAFEQAALGLVAVMVDPAALREAEGVRVDFVCRAPDAEVLLADWLNALILEMAVREVLFGRVSVGITPAPGGLRLEASAWGEPLERAELRPAVEVKGATFTALAVTEAPDGTWRAQCVVDV